jgi:ketosteroid isomerase-like protein
MKPTLLVALLCLAGTMTTMASPSHPVIAAEKARGAALVKGDAKTVANLLADDLQYTHSNGRREGKKDVVSALEAKSLAYERFVLADLEAREVTRDVAVLTGKIDQRKRSSGQWGDARLLFHAVWRNESGTWRLVSLQTAMPPAPKS